MPLHINLYHEVRQQQHARKRDPLKLGMLALLVVGVGFVGYYFVRLGKSHEVHARLTAAQADWEKLEEKQTAAKAREDELNMNIKLAEALMKRIDDRFFWGPVLAQVLASVPREVQLVRSVFSVPQERVAAPTVNVFGLAGSDAPRKAAEELRKSLEGKFAQDFKKTLATFRTLDDSDESVVLDGKRYATAAFSIEFQLDRGEEPAPAPVRRKVAAK